MLTSNRHVYLKIDQKLFILQELNPNVEAKLSYLLKFVQKSIEEDKQKEETKFTLNEVSSLMLDILKCT